MLGQKPLEVPREVGAGGGELEVVALLRVGDGAAAQKRRPDVGAEAPPALEQPRVDLQAELPPGGAEEGVHPRRLVRRVDAELVHRAAGVVPTADGAADAAAGKTPPGIAGGLFLFGLDEQAVCIESFGKAGQAVAGRPQGSVPRGLACGDLASGRRGKAHTLSPFFQLVFRFNGRRPGAGCWWRSPVSGSSPRSCGQR